MKKCTKCKEDRELTDYYKNKSKSTGFETRCKACAISHASKWQKENKDKVNLKNKLWRDNNKDKTKLYNETWSAKNVDYKRIIKLKAQRDREARKIQAIPSWVNKELVKDIYIEASYQNMQVDHIVPLNSKTVCGLHWEGNMQLLTAADNQSKGNRYWEDM